MIINSFAEFNEFVVKNKRLLGIDFGTKNIGLAISDKDLNIATPKITIKRKNNIVTSNDILKFIQDNQVFAIIFGFPLNEKNEETSFCKHIMNFINFFETKCNLPIFLHNEKYTSSLVEEEMINNLNQSFSTVKENIDKISASYILQSFLELLKYNNDVKI